VMGWAAGQDHTPSQLLMDVVARSQTSIVFLHLAERQQLRRIGVALRGSGNLPLMVRVATALAEQHDGEVQYFNVLPEHFGREQLASARAVQIEAMRRHVTPVPYRLELLPSDNPMQAIVKRSADLDLLVIGAARDSVLGDGDLGSFSSTIVQSAHCSVVVARRFSSVDRTVGKQLNTVREIHEDVIDSIRQLFKKLG